MKTLIKTIISIAGIGSAGLLFFLTYENAIDVISNISAILDGEYLTEPMEMQTIYFISGWMLLMTLLLNLATKDTDKGGQNG